MKCNNIIKRYGDKTVFENFSIEFEKNKITSILGASGIGKTTLLNILSGMVEFEGKIEDKPTAVSYMFQEKRLLPHLSVAKNIDYVLKSVIKNKDVRKEKIDDILNKVGLKNEKNKFPHELSGGMEQRLALARAFVFDAELLLMDEPFKELDISLKKKMFVLFKTLFSENPKTTILATHDLDDALRLSDRIIVLGEGGKILLDKEILQNSENALEQDTERYREEIYSVL